MEDVECEQTRQRVQSAQGQGMFSLIHGRVGCADTFNANHKIYLIQRLGFKNKNIERKRVQGLRKR